MIMFLKIPRLIYFHCKLIVVPIFAMRLFFLVPQEHQNQLGVLRNFYKQVLFVIYLEELGLCSDKVFREGLSQNFS